MDWELLMAFALGTGLVIDTFFIIEDGDEDAEENRN